MIKLATKFGKFITVGGIGALIQLGVFNLFTKVFGVHTFGDNLSLVIAIGCAATWNFTANYRWTFKK